TEGACSTLGNGICGGMTTSGRCDGLKMAQAASTTTTTKTATAVHPRFPNVLRLGPTVWVLGGLDDVGCSRRHAIWSSQHPCSGPRRRQCRAMSENGAGSD